MGWNGMGWNGMGWNGVGWNATGAAVSTVQVRVAAEASTLPAASVALTEKVCDPSERPVSDFGDEQETQAPESSLHSKLEPASDEENEKLAELELVTPDGPEAISVSGGEVSGASVSAARVR